MKERTLERGRATRNERARVKERKAARTLERNATTKADKERSRQRGKNRRGEPVDEGNSMMLWDLPVTDFFSLFLLLLFSFFFFSTRVSRLISRLLNYSDRYLSVCELFLNEIGIDYMLFRIYTFLLSIMHLYLLL